MKLQITNLFKRNRKLEILVSFVLLFNITIQAQQTPADAQSSAITIVGATAHIGNGQIIDQCTLVFEDGVITAIGKSIETKGQIIKADGQHVYPGFIMPNSTLGLGEIDAVRASVDQDEIGDFLPHIRSLIAYNAESKVVESMRPNGVLLAQITPRGGTISGTSSVVQLDAWNWEDAAVKTDEGIHLNWPSSFTSGRWWLGEPRGLSPNKNYKSQVSKIESFFKSAKSYGQMKTKRHLPFEAVQGLFNGNQKLYIHANATRDIIDGITFAKANGVKNVVLVGGYQAPLAIDVLKKHQIPVLIRRTQSLPAGNDDDYDYPYKLPKILVDQGILVGLENSGSMERMNSRNLPFYAGQVVGQGLEKEKALQLITENTAKILGIDKNYGTLAVGKSATLFISSGDALDMRTNQLSHAFIDGRALSLETYQTKLWKRYSGKFSKE